MRRPAPPRPAVLTPWSVPERRVALAGLDALRADAAGVESLHVAAFLGPRTSLRTADDRLTAIRVG